MDDSLVVALLAAINEREQLAHNASVHGDTWHTRFDGDVYAGDRELAEGPDGWKLPEGPHMAANDPVAVLRRCRADRDLVAEWRKRKQMADQLASEGDAGAAAVAAAITAGLWAAVTLVAGGYGLGESSSVHSPAL